MPTLSSAVQKPPSSVEDNRRINTRQFNDFRLKILHSLRITIITSIVKPRCQIRLLLFIVIIKSLKFCCKLADWQSGQNNLEQNIGSGISFNIPESRDGDY